MNARALKMPAAAKLLLLLLSLPAAAQTPFTYTNADGSIYYYSINADGSANIAGYTGTTNWNVAIPTTINGLAVTSIGRVGEESEGWNGVTNITIPDSVTNIGVEAFEYSYSLASVTIGSSVTIPDSVTSIGELAFWECTSLASVTIGNSVTSIGELAFWECTSLASVTIPNSVTSIGEGAFASSMVITVDLNNLAYSSVDGVLFNKSKTTLVECPGGRVGAYTIPDSVTNIGEGAFTSCSSLTSVTIPDSVTSIGDFAFSGCSSLTSVTIPGSVTSIGDDAFHACFSLTSVTIPDSVTSIGSYVFEYCSSLASVTIPDSVTSIGDYVFEFCPSLASVTIGSSVTGIDTFAGCYNLTNVSIGNSVTSIEEGAFSSCTNLASITIPASVTSIGYAAFDSCSALTNITIPDSVTSIGDEAFFVCTSLTSVTIGSSVIYIGEYAFSSCSSLTSVTIGKGVTSIEEDAFYRCPRLTGVYFQGNSPTPTNDLTVFSGDTNGIVYYQQATTGWGTNFDGLPTMLLPTGSLQVTIMPSNAVSAGVEWQVDRGVWNTNGAVVSGLSLGTNHILAFNLIYGWTSPSNQMVSITNGATNRAAGLYKLMKVKKAKEVTVTITSPKASQKLSLANDLFTVTGTAKDNLPAADHAAVESVFYQLNGGSWTPATPSNSAWANWSARIIPKPGPNTVGAYAMDTSNNVSSTTKVAFTYIPSATLIVRTNGPGGITPVDNGKLLAIGSNYSLTASPDKNSVFSNWVAIGNTNFVSNNAVLNLTMQSNLTLTANFVTNPFPAIQGTYNGLFFQTNAGSPVTEQSSGFATITISSTSKGAYSAVLKVDGASYSFSSAFDLNGNSATNITRKGKSPLALTLHIDPYLNPPGDSITGSVEASDWTGPSGLLADLAWFNGATLKATNYAGKYTLVFPGSNTPATSPGGYSVAKFTNNLAGNAVLTGSLADNTTITSLSTPISKEGYVPIYYSYTPGTNVIFGWLNFTNDPTQTVEGELTWFKLPTTSKVLYSNGFTIQTNIIGSPYAPETTNTLVTNGTLTIVDLDQDIDLVYTNVSIISNKLTFATPPTNQLTATITSSTGAISLSFRPTGAKANLTAQGVVSQDPPTDLTLKAAGWFAGTNQTGYFILTQ